MATEESFHEPGRPGERTTEGYVSPMVDFLLLFTLSAVVAVLATSVLIP